MQSNRREFVEQTVFLLVAAAAAVIVSKLLLGLFSPLLFGFAIALALRPLTHAISHNTGLQRRSSSMAAALFFYIMLILIFIGVSAYLLGQAAMLVQGAPTFFSLKLMPGLEALNTDIINFMSSLSEEMGIGAQSFFTASSEITLTMLSSFSGWLAHIVTAFVTKLPVYALGAVLTVVLSVLISADLPQFTAFFLRQLSPVQQKLAHGISSFFADCLVSLAKAYGTLFLITAAEMSAGLWLLGVSVPFSSGILIAMLDILPAIGSAMVLLPWAFVSFVSGNSALGTGLLLLFLFSEIVRNVLEPKIVGEHTGLNPIVTISAMFAGIKLIGVAGVFLAPIAVLLIKYLNKNGVIRLYK